LMEMFLSAWISPFKYTWENFTERWRSVTEWRNGNMTYSVNRP
jgi:hypothetical protein